MEDCRKEVTSVLGQLHSGLRYQADRTDQSRWHEEHTALEHNKVRITACPVADQAVPQGIGYDDLEMVVADFKVGGDIHTIRSHDQGIDSGVVNPDLGHIVDFSQVQLERQTRPQIWLRDLDV